MPANPSAPLTGRIAADDPGVTELFAVLAYGEISAFYRLAEDAQLSPSLRGKLEMAKMAAAEMTHFETLEVALSARGVEVFDAMAPFVRALDAYHASTSPSTWLESMVKAYVGDGIAADFYREIADALAPEVAATVRDVLAETGALGIRRRRGAFGSIDQPSGEGPAHAVGSAPARGGDHPGAVRDGAA